MHTINDQRPRRFRRDPFYPAPSRLLSTMQRPFLIALAAFLLIGTALAEPINDWCPVTPAEPSQSHLTVEFEGQTIGLCCRKCVREFLANPERYRANLRPASEVETETTALEADQLTRTLDRSDNSIFARIWRLLGNVHILAVHFPIALLLLAAPLEAAAVLRSSAEFAFAARANFFVGAAAALLAAGLGWIAASNSHFTGDAASILEWHRWLGTSLAVVAVVGGVALLVEHRGHRCGTLLFRTILIILPLLIPLAAHLGGSLVYGPNHLALPMR